jgi:hypothetical protein
MARRGLQGQLGEDILRIKVTRKIDTDIRDDRASVLVRDDEPRLISNDRALDRGASAEQLVARIKVGRRQLVAISGIPGIHLGGPVSVGIVDAGVDLQRVSTGLRDHIDRATEVVAILRVEGAGEHLDLLDCIEVEVERECARDRVGDVDTVQHIGVLIVASAANIGVRTTGHTSRHLHSLLVAPTGRDAVQELLGEHRAAARRLRIDGRTALLDHQLLAGCAERQGDGEDYVATNVDLQLRVGLLGKARLLGNELVLARRQLSQQEAAVGIGKALPLPHQIVGGDGNHHPGDGDVSIVHSYTLDGAGCHRGVHYARHDKDEDEQELQQSLESGHGPFLGTRPRVKAGASCGFEASVV